MKFCCLRFLLCILLLAPAAPCLAQVSGDSLLRALVPSLQQLPQQQQVDSMLVVADNISSAFGTTSIQLASRASNMAFSIDYALGQQEGYRVLGKTHFTLGHYDQATKYLLEALKLAKKNSGVGSGAIYNLLGNVSLISGSLTEARHYYRMALAKAQQENDAELEATCYNNIGEVAYLELYYDSAFLFYGMAQERYGQLHDTLAMATPMHNRGRVLASQKELFRKHYHAGQCP